MCYYRCYYIWWSKGELLAECSRGTFISSWVQFTRLYCRNCGWCVCGHWSYTPSRKVYIYIYISFLLCVGLCCVCLCGCVYTLCSRSEKWWIGWLIAIPSNWQCAYWLHSNRRPWSCRSLSTSSWQVLVAFMSIILFSNYKLYDLSSSSNAILFVLSFLWEDP